MHELMLKYLRGEATDFESRSLDRWRSESSENELEFQGVAGLWRAMEGLPTSKPPPAPRLARIVQEAERRRTHRQTRAAPGAVLSSPWAGYGLAAAAIVALVLVGVRDQDRRNDTPTRLAAVESSSGPGEVTTMSLSDGSIVRVAADTRIEFPSVANRREVVLAGKAFFAVAKGDLPFVVRTRAGQVRVRGTRFEVVVEDGQLRLVVVEGNVELGVAGEVFPVAAGQVAYVSEGSAPRVIDRADVWRLLEWRGGLMLFQDTPLSQVAEEVRRQFGRNVRIDDPALGERRITAWFENESLEEVVSALCLVAGARCEVSESEVTIGR